ncbi:MAG TPA: hypothetical protein VNN74_10050 [Candidatus Micrarchaeia archaeon]|nr:hypothetical protein [Candidatus Micrarchaeia archaeon]
MKETHDTLTGWFLGRVPSGWYTAPPTLTVDREEILVVGDLDDPALPADATEATIAAAREARARRFREETRPGRMAIAEEAQHRFRRHVAWGVVVGGERHLFTTLSVPVMTRLRLAERQVLDTLVDAGVARSRSHALAWCVRLVGRHQGDWIESLRQALTAVESVRAQGPDPSPTPPPEEAPA